MKVNRKIVWNLIFLFVPSVLFADFFYVRPPGQTYGSGNGTNWNNAHSGLPATLQRGSVYFLADGDYPGYSFDDAPDGSKQITIKKAVANSHGSATDWNSEFGNGQAIFGPIKFDNPNMGYITIDGQEKYGIKIAFGDRQVGVDFIRGARDITLRYLDIAGPGGSTFYPYPASAWGIDLSPWNGTGYDSSPNLKIQHCAIHGGDTLLLAANAPNMLIEYSKFYDVLVDISGKPNDPLHPNVYYDNGGTDNSTFRFNEVYNWHVEGLFFPYYTTGWKIYGNIFRNSLNVGRGIEVARVWGDSSFGTMAIYNNVFANLMYTPISIRADMASGSGAYNNIFWKNEEIWEGKLYEYGPGFGNMPHDNNLYYKNDIRGEAHGVAGGLVDPFSTDGSFHLNDGSLAVNAGKNLSMESGFSPDMGIDAEDHVRGANGGWDIGAFEISGPVTPVNGRCGTSGVNSCQDGRLNDITDSETHYLWVCNGIGTGSPSSTCSVQKIHTLTVTKLGTGTGTVTGQGISCGSDCSETYGSPTSVTLTGVPTSGNNLSWSGCTPVSGYPNQCTVSVSGLVDVAATFTDPSMGPTVSLQSPTPPVAPGTVLTASYTGTTMAKDWIGLYKTGANNQTYIAWSYVFNRPNGSVQITVPTNTTGPLELRMLANDGYVSMAVSASFSVGVVTSTDPTVNNPPVVTAITHDAIDRNSNTPTLDVYPGTTVTYSGSASDSEGVSLFWTWFYSANGGSNISFRTGSGTIEDAMFTYPTYSGGTNYVWTIEVTDGENTTRSTLPVSVLTEIPVGENHPTGETKFISFTNPFNPLKEKEVMIKFDLEQDGPIKLSVYTMGGDLVKNVFDGTMTAGVDKSASWEGTNLKNEVVVAGIYLLKLNAGGKMITTKIAVVK